ncbi:MAG: hypothetical protein RLZZ282_1675 [Verrucomicrobiota bacterium]
MSKSTDHVLLVPGDSGWEIWTRHNDGPSTLHRATDIERAGDLAGLPSGEISLFFPVKSLTAVPLRVTSDDAALFPDLAALHAERLGLRPDPMAGQLTDVFVVAREPENTALLAVFLRSPSDGDLPPRGPKCFDLSARAFPVDGNVLALWKEFGRWVFAAFTQGKLVYCQATAVDADLPDDSLAREIRLSLIQLAMQGMDVEPGRVVVWTHHPAPDLTPLTRAFVAPVEIAPRPVPVLPNPLSKLLPADVRAARRAALQHRNVMLGVAAVALIYLGLIGWFGYGLWQGMKETRSLVAQAQLAAPDGEAYAQHVAKWNELSHVIDLTNSPVDILQRIATCIPPSSGLRLRIAEISATDIKITGEAPQLPPVNSFSLKLTKNTDLSNFTWQTPESTQSTRGWEFGFIGAVPAAESNP